MITTKKKSSASATRQKPKPKASVTEIEKPVEQIEIPTPDVTLATKAIVSGPLETREKDLSINIAFSGLYSQFKGLGDAEITQIEAYAYEIELQHSKAIETMIAIGESLLAVKAILSDKVKIKESKGKDRGSFMLWATERICTPLGVSYATIARWISVTEEVRNNPSLKSNILSMQPTALYETVKSSFPAELKTAILSSDSAALTRGQIQDIKKLHAAASAQKLKIEPEAIVDIVKAEITPSNTIIRQVSKLSAEGQIRVAKALVETPAEAMNILEQEVYRKGEHPVIEITGENVSHEETPVLSLASELSGVWHEGITKLPAETINLAIVECPLDQAWKDTEHGLNYVSQHLYTALAPGGMAMIFLGHVSILSSVNYLSQLKALHLLTCRKQPGHTPINVGVNVGFAAVHAVLVYKEPFKAPDRIVYDLQTYQTPEVLETSEELGTSEAPLAGLEEVATGIEQGIFKFLDVLVRSQDGVAHIVAGPRQFNLRSVLIDKLQDLKASKVYFVGGGC